MKKSPRFILPPRASTPKNFLGVNFNSASVEFWYWFTVLSCISHILLYSTW
ncbi:MAG: DUF2759 family protein [Ignavibacteria bacterium]